MARKKSSRCSPDVKSSSMFPVLHQNVVNALSGAIPSVWFKRNNTDQGSSDQYSTFVMGRFQCDNAGCAKDGWSSKKVAILIRRFPRNGYNAVVFGQRCQSCHRLGSLTLDENSYVDRVTYRLQKWAGVVTEKQDYFKKEGPPHRSDLCEGCKRGYCQQKNNWEY